MWELCTIICVCIHKYKERGREWELILLLHLPYLAFNLNCIILFIHLDSAYSSPPKKDMRQKLKQFTLEEV